jgi:ornithine cyclodeaminase/alanine dehydrogenase
MDLQQDRELISQKLNIGSEILYITRQECISAEISLDRILDLTRDALVAHGRKEYEMPAKIGVHPFPEVFFHAMPAYVPAKNAIGVKWIECYPNNPKKFNIPQTTGLLILNDVLSGCPIAIMDCTWLTAMRTPAVTVLAAQALHGNAEHFGMFGCGVQGVEHVRFAPKTLKKLKKIYIYDVAEVAMDNLIKQVQPEIDVEIVKGKTPGELAEKCEALSSATLITKDTLSIVKDGWISGGQTILPCDLNTFWDPKISKRADKYIVDSIDEHKLFAGMGYFPDGLSEIKCETGEIIAGLKKGRESERELIVCSNIGISACDMVLGREIFNRALERGIGTKMTL